MPSKKSFSSRSREEKIGPNRKNNSSAATLSTFSFTLAAFVYSATHCVRMAAPLRKRVVKITDEEAEPEIVSVTSTFAHGAKPAPVRESTPSVIVMLISMHKIPELRCPLPCGVFSKFEEFRDFLLTDFTVNVPGDPSAGGVSKTGYKIYDANRFAVYVGETFGRLHPVPGIRWSEDGRRTASAWSLGVWSFAADDKTQGPLMVSERDPEYSAKTKRLEDWKKLRALEGRVVERVWITSTTLCGVYFASGEEACRHAWELILHPSTEFEGTPILVGKAKTGKPLVAGR